MAMQYVHVIKVSGSLPFPIDMLRYDRCTPNTEADSGHISTSMDADSGSVTVELMKVNSQVKWQPTEGRWLSFGWKVLDVRTQRA